MLFAKKPDGSLCFFIDYHALSKITVKDSNPLPQYKLNGLTGKCKVLYVIGFLQQLLEVLYRRKRYTKDSILNLVQAI